MSGYWTDENGYRTNGIIAIHPNDPNVRRGCAAGGEACHEKGPYPGPRLRCRIGLHANELNFYRHTVNHYHCLFCGRGVDR